MGILICKIQGTQVQAPEGWKGVQSLMTWDNESVQANITTTNFTFVGDAARIIKTHFDNGGAFQGLEITFEDYEDDGSSYVFDGYIDFTEGYFDLTPNDDNQYFKVVCTVKEKNQIDTFKAKAAGTTFALLKQQGFITVPDFKNLLYVIQKPYDPFEVLMITIQLIQSALEIARLARDITDIALNTAAHIGGGITGPIAGTVYAIAMGIAEAVYAAVVVLKIVQLFNALLEIFLPMPRFGKVLSMRRLAEIACLGIGGYNFKSSIPELDEWYVFPSKDLIVTNLPFETASTDTGFFNTKDFGYIVNEYFQAMEKIFHGKFKIFGADAHFEPLINDGFWLTNSTYQQDDVFVRGYRYNTDELAATRLIKLSEDDLDSWTKEKYSGTAYEIHTEHVTPPADPKLSLLKGYDEISIPWALGNQKDKKNQIEELFSQISGLITSIANFFGSPVDPYLNAYKHISSALKISQDVTKLPKLLSCTPITEAGKPYLVLKNNQRAEVSPEVFYNNWIIDKSFVANSFRGQWRIYENIRVPFSRSKFVAIGNNNYFKDMNGNVCRMDKIEWNHGEDTANATYRVRVPYTNNLKETIITT